MRRCQVTTVLDRPAGMALLLCALFLLAGAWGISREALGYQEEGVDYNWLSTRQMFDKLVMKDGTEVKIEKLPRPAKQPIRKASTKFLVKPLDDQESEYEVDLKELDVVVWYEDILLAEANALIDEGKFDEAFDYFDFFQDREGYHDWPGVTEAHERYLFQEARVSFQAGKADYAYGILTELHSLNPEYEGLKQALGGIVEQRIKAAHSAANYEAARTNIAGLKARYPDHPIAAKWQKQLEKDAQTLVKQTGEQVKADALREAYASASRAMEILPTFPAAQRAMAELRRIYPRVVVGVTSPAPVSLSGGLYDVGARRLHRLVNRELLELAGIGPEGSVYRSQFGDVTRDELDLRLDFRVAEGVPWIGSSAMLSAHDVAHTFKLMADPAHPSYNPAWGAMFRSTQLRDAHTVEVRISRGHVRPELFLQVAPVPWDGRLAASGASLSGYHVAERDGAQAICLLKQVDSSSPQRPREIVERHYADTRDAVQALRKGEINILDRVFPWELKQVSARPELTVSAYSMPSVHCLVLNPAQKFTKDRSFRRAIIYAINRESILRKQLLQSDDESLGQVISGIFPRGRDADDPSGYADDPTIAPRPFDPRLSVALVGLTLGAMNKNLPKEAAAITVPTLTLVHPPHDLARISCKAIAQYLKAVKIEVTLVERAPSENGEYDLKYVELAPWEPLVDARRVLGSTGLAGRANSYMELALARIDGITSWREGRQRLHDLHRVAYDDASVVPLWQLTEHFAYQKSVSGIGSSPVTLYQNVDSWRLDPPSANKGRK